jgi:hypothetical protein
MVESNGLEFLCSIPKIESSPFEQHEKLFEPHDKDTRLDRWLAQLGMLLAGGVDGALFIMIGQRMKIVRPAGGFAK